LFSSLALIALFWFWQPMGGLIWQLESPAAVNTMYVVYAAGWLLLLYSTFLINHFDLFGLRQVWLHLRGKPYTQLAFRTPWLYRQVRHPLYVGWLMIFWATPTMTVAHLLFAVMTTEKPDEPHGVLRPGLRQFHRAGTGACPRGGLR
jgi:protein-S-isoprenylcysteine O-methyltransferase Ste14